MARDKIVITGAAGLLGQNLIPCLKLHGFSNIVAIDKHPEISGLGHHSDITIIHADLACDNGWQSALANADVVVCAHAQIGGLKPEPFDNNNILATRRLLDAARGENVGYLVHISSAAVSSKAVNLYSESKKMQEALVQSDRFPAVILRPTLMFGRFDRKNLGWIVRFMRSAPVLPIPGNGRFVRQPLYVGDFCEIIRTCIERRICGEYNISGLTKIDYIDLIRTIRTTLQLSTPFIKIPLKTFKLLLKIYALIDRNPPFTDYQLEAFTTPDAFEVIDWPGIFGVNPTALDAAIAETFLDPHSEFSFAA